MSLPLNCSVLNCTSASKSLSSHDQKKVNFFNFPNDAKILLKWILFTGRGTNWRPGDSHKICSEHFQESAFIENEEFQSSKRKLLKPNAIPTVVTLDECDDDVEYVMEEEDSDEEPIKEEKNLKKRAIETVTRTSTDSRKRRSEDNDENTLASKKPRAKETQSEVEKGEKGKHLFAQQFMEFVGVYDPEKQSKKFTKNRKSNSKPVNQESSRSHENQTHVNNTTKNNQKMQENNVSDDECNDEENQNLISTVDAIKKKLDSVEQTLLNVLDQIDTIRKDVLNVVKSTQNSKSTVKAGTKVSHESGNGSTNRKQNVCTYLKEDQRSHIKKSISSTQSQSNTFSKRFPIQTTHAFEKFNIELNTTPELEQLIINMFQQTNDSRVEVFLEENLKNLINENVAKSMSWSGLNSKFAVKNTPAVALLRDALVTRFNCQVKSPAVNKIRLYFGK